MSGHNIDVDDLVSRMEAARDGRPAPIASGPSVNPDYFSVPHPVGPVLAHEPAHFPLSPYHGFAFGPPSFSHTYSTHPWGGGFSSSYAPPFTQLGQPIFDQALPSSGFWPDKPGPAAHYDGRLPSPRVEGGAALPPAKSGDEIAPLIGIHDTPVGAFHLDLGGLKPEESYPSPPSIDGVITKDNTSIAAPAIRVNAELTSTSRVKSPVGDDSLDDDGWIDEVIAEMDEAKASGQRAPDPGYQQDPPAATQPLSLPPQPCEPRCTLLLQLAQKPHVPGPTQAPPIPSPLVEAHRNVLKTDSPLEQQVANAPLVEVLEPTQRPAPPLGRRSPYFTNNAEPATPLSVRQEHTPPSRTRSASTVRFPKLPPPPAGHTPPADAKLFPAVQLPSTTGPRKFTQKESVPRVSVYALETPEERQLFSFREFNDMQSTIFQTAYKTDQNMVVSAPTGSGKTTVFELAFLRMLQFKSSGYIPLAIYMAPTKALCSERHYDWRERFKSLNVKCVELTGDTEIHNIQTYTESADLIITTPEKWDSVTRRAYSIQSRLYLMMIDEVHTLHEDRGATLEVVVSRMKKRGDGLRFVAVSATVPNIDDVARWIGSKKQAKPSEQTEEDELMSPSAEDDDIEQMPKARVFKFGDEYRPVPLTLHAVGVDAPNEFALGSRLDKELWCVLNQHTRGLPTLVFCPTRKACQLTAEHLFQEYKNALSNHTRLPWDASDNQRVILKDAKIQKWTELGIAIHHAGVDLLDRRNIEQAFRNSKLHLLVATSTLAVGVNLPAHLVVIKGTSCWAGQGFREYSDIDIQQMMGRAGRPQFDDSGTVVIMCNNTKLHKYQSMMHSKTILESCLHQHLTEHINSEIGLGTIGSLQNAQEWLRGTFLSIRIRQNPKHYQETMTKDHAKSWDATLDRFVETSVSDLKKHDFITDDLEEIKGRTEDGTEPKELLPTNLGTVMSQNFISYKTMCHIVSMEADSNLRSLLELLAGSTEFSRLRIRQGEAALLNKLRVHKDIKYHLDTPAKTYADKVFLLAQVTFGNVNLEEFTTKTENTSPLQTQIQIFNAAPRIARAIFNVTCHKQYGAAAVAALELCHTVNGKAWEDTSTVFRQIDKVGPKSISVMQSNAIHTFDDLLKLQPSRIEMWLNRHPPFGSEVLECAAALPRFTIRFIEEGRGQDENGYPTVQLRLQIKNSGQLVHKTPKAGGTSGSQTRTKVYNLIVLTVTTKDNRFVDKRAISTNRFNDRVREFGLEVTLYYPDESIRCLAGVEERSGLSRTYVYKPRIPADKFPVRKGINNRTSGSEPDSSPQKRPSNAARRSNSPLFLDIDDSDSDELIDLTVPSSVRVMSKSKKRPRDVKERRPLALAVKAFFDDEAIDDDEEPGKDDEEDADDGFIVRGDRSPPLKLSRLAGKTSVRPEGVSIPTSKRVSASSGSKSSKRSVAIGKHFISPQPALHRDMPARDDTGCDIGTGRKGTEDDAGRPQVVARTNPPAPRPDLSVDEQFEEWFGEFL